MINILFLTTGRMDSIEQHAIYPDLLRQFRDHGHSVFCVSPYERRMNKKTEYVDEYGVHMLHVRIGNITKTNLIEKGASTLLIERQFIAAIKRYFPGVKFDFALYSTPPITFCNAIRFIKKRDGAKTYLLLKDIFPQNAVDLGLMSKTGLRGFLYKYFRAKEKTLYSVSDYIGCMSQANLDYVLKHNPKVDPKSVEICPNCIEVIDKSVDNQTRKAIREKYGIPQDKAVFIYGGNLGKPQGIDFVIKCMKSQRTNEAVFFLIVGDGTEYGKLEAYVASEKQHNLKLMKRLPKEDYDAMVGACDVGLIFLDHRFTIPNFPSRILSYMQAKIPVFAVTDPNTDVGNVIVDGKFGWWCESNDVQAFNEKIFQILRENMKEYGLKAYSYLMMNYSTHEGYTIIMRHGE